MTRVLVRSVSMKGLSTSLIVEAYNPETDKAISYMFQGRSSRSVVPIEELVAKSEELRKAVEIKT